MREPLLAGPSVWGRKSRRGLAGAGGAGSRLPAAQTVGTRFNWPKAQQDGGTAAALAEDGGGRGKGGLGGCSSGAGGLGEIIGEVETLDETELEWLIINKGRD